jgi:hypothetical protein
MKISKEGYEGLIESVDDLLRIISRHINYPHEEERERWLRRADGSLDERLRLMKLRDAA